MDIHNTPTKDFMPNQTKTTFFASFSQKHRCTLWLLMKKEKDANELRNGTQWQMAHNLIQELILEIPLVKVELKRTKT